MKGFFNRLLRIDLTGKEFTHEEIPDSVLEKTLGGKGLGAYLLLKENPAGVEPFAPNNIFVIAAGPITGTRMWSQSRFGVYSKSPATEGYGESYCGSVVAQRMKGCGIDAVILRGKCPNLTFLCLNCKSNAPFQDNRKP